MLRKLLVGLGVGCLALASVLPAWAQTPTTNYGWLKPTIGASANTWGNNLNGDLDGIDSTVFGVSGVANAACPKAGCTFTGGISGTTASFSAAVTFGLTTTHTGLATFNGGITDNGALSVTGASTFGGYTNFTINAASTLPPSGGAAVGWNYTGGSGEVDLWDAFSSAGECFNFYWKNGPSTGTLLLGMKCTGELDLTGSLVTPGQVNAAGVTTSNGLAVTGGTVTLPAASIVNADLDTVNGSGGACTACNLTINAQGRVTTMASGTVLPSMSAATSGAFLTNNGSTASWSQRASAYFSSCSSGGCTLGSGNGVSSVTRSSTGSYTVNFSVTFSNTNYTIICTSGTYGGNGDAICTDAGFHGTTSAGITIHTGGNNPIDPSNGFNILILQN